MTKITFEVTAVNADIDLNLGEFASLDEALAAGLAADLPASTLVEVQELTYADNGYDRNYVKSSRYVADFETA